MGESRNRHPDNGLDNQMPSLMANLVANLMANLMARNMAQNLTRGMTSRQAPTIVAGPCKAGMPALILAG